MFNFGVTKIFGHSIFYTLMILGNQLPPWLPAAEKAALQLL